MKIIVEGKEIATEKAAKSSPNIYLVALAAMEAYRLKGGDNDPPDYAIRVCQSILADVLGFNDRVMWTEKIQSEGLLSYNGDYKQQYKTLIERMRGDTAK